MNIAKMSPDEIRVAGMKALLHELGPVGLIRFLQQFETGSGDYSLERQGWLPESGIGSAGGTHSRRTAAPGGMSQARGRCQGRAGSRCDGGGSGAAVGAVPDDPRPR
jgi:hypothetical protein